MTPSTEKAEDHRRLPISAVILIPAVGAPAIAVALSLMFLTFGPTGLIVGPIYALFWIPRTYAQFGPPLMVGGITYAAAVWAGARPALYVAMLAAATGYGLFATLFPQWAEGLLLASDVGPPGYGNWVLASVAALAVIPGWWMAKRLSR